MNRFDTNWIRSYMSALIWLVTNIYIKNRNESWYEAHHVRVLWSDLWHVIRGVQLSREGKILSWLSAMIFLQSLICSYSVRERCKWESPEKNSTTDFSPRMWRNMPSSPPRWRNGWLRRMRGEWDTTSWRRRRNSRGELSRKGIETHQRISRKGVVGNVEVKCR